MTPKRFMVIAGEASGDMLAAELVRELRAGMERRFTYTTNVQPLNADLAPQFFGAGGQNMASAGVELAFDLTQHSVIGPSGLLKNFLHFKRMFDELVALAIEREPHVIICVDFSVFNHRFAAAIKNYVRARRGTFNNWNPKIIKYISPQVWGSREGRVYKMARDFDLVLSIFPFEKDWFAARVPKLRVEFVGHPVVERYSKFGRTKIAAAATDETRPLVLLLPGSRTGELKRHLPVMLGALKLMQAAIPNLRARMIVPTEKLVEQVKEYLIPAEIELQCGGLEEALQQATVAISKTGTITMECAYFGVPTVTLYKLSWWEYQIGKQIVKVKFASMPNLLANEAVFPEFIQYAATPENISRAALELLREPARRKQVQARLAEIISSLGGPGASRRAAEAILNVIT
jgi:lipid-A-disaccharide synthase